MMEPRDPKPIHWVGASLLALRGFPPRAREIAGYQLWRIQIGLDPDDWKPMRGVGPGVREIRIHVGQEYRVIYVATFHECIHVLHAFRKTTERTSSRDLEMARRRLASVMRDRSRELEP